MRFQNTLLVAIVALLSFRDVEASTCFMLYMVADSSMESKMLERYAELAQSDLVTSSDIQVWVYYDGAEIQALPNTVDSSGNPVDEPFAGSRYITYDPDFTSMRIDAELTGEQNSDTPGQIEDFVGHALASCLADGYESLMLVFSGMGGGFAGFGGDENTRKLLQTNGNIAFAIRNALDIAGGPEKLEVIAFEGNSMQGLGAVDDYTGVAHNMLASEAIMPSHGFDYSNLTSAPSATVLSFDILLSYYLYETQGGESTPKTLSLVDLAGFETFVSDWEVLFATISSLLADNDSSLFAFLSRARASAVSFVGIIDAAGSRVPFEPSEMDIGSFLTTLQELCSPGEMLQTPLESAITSYQDMFLGGGDIYVSPGTPPGTGMACTWPTQIAYNANPALWDQVLFQNINYVTESAPNFRAFLQEFLPSTSAVGDGTSICTKSAEPTEAQNVFDLIIEDSFTTSGATGAKQVQLEATISADVSQVLVEYGLDVSRFFGARFEVFGFSSSPDDYVYLLGGEVPAAFENDTVSASWGEKFYFLNVSSSRSETLNLNAMLYVFDDGGGAKRSPCMYFPEERGDDLRAMEFSNYVFFDFDYWIGQGAQFCNLFFSDRDDNVALYVSNGAGVWEEQAKEAEGYVVHLLYVDGLVQNTRVHTFPGGLNINWIRWRPSTEYKITSRSATEIFESSTQADAIQLRMHAVNHGDPVISSEDFRYYDVLRRSGCLDADEWVDASGDNCTWYETGDRCARFGTGNAGPDNTTARESCCTCAGGVPISTVAPSVPDCSDIPGFLDFGSDDCSWYIDDADHCNQWGDVENSDGTTANEACCVCGGGDLSGGTEVAEPSKKQFKWLPGGFGP